MTFEEIKELRSKRRAYWKNLKAKDPEEYKKQRAQLRPIAERWQAETDAMSSDEDIEK